MNLHALIFASALIALTPFTTANAQSYTFQVPSCGEYTLFPKAIDDQGAIVGGAEASSLNYAVAFVYKTNTCKTIFLGTRGTSFSDITDTGQVIGFLGPSAGQPNQPYIESRGVFQGLPQYPDAEDTYYCCISPSGLLAGNYIQQLTGLSQYGFVLRNGTFTPLPHLNPLGNSQVYGINNSGVVVGTSYGDYAAGFTYRDGKMKYFVYPGAKYTTFNGINQNNLVVGTYLLNGSDANGIFLYNLDTAVWTDLNWPFPYNDSMPVGINNAGVIIAEYTPSGGLLIATPQP